MNKLPFLQDTNFLVACVRAGFSSNPENNKTTIISVITFPKILSKDLSVIFPKATTYNLAVRLAQKLFDAGTPVKSTDIIIAAIAIEKQLAVRTNDVHFSLIQKVEQKLQAENSQQ